MKKHHSGPVSNNLLQSILWVLPSHLHTPIPPIEILSSVRDDYGSVSERQINRGLKELVRRNWITRHPDGCYYEDRVVTGYTRRSIKYYFLELSNEYPDP